MREESAGFFLLFLAIGDLAEGDLLLETWKEGVETPLGFLLGVVGLSVLLFLWEDMVPAKE
jgi:hypothetical protein